jgi:hypothetical protein
VSLKLSILFAPLLLATALALPFKAAAEEQPAQQFLKYESKEGGYSIDLPLDWDVKANVRDWDCFAFAPRDSAKPDEFLDCASVALLDGKEGKGASYAADALLAALKAKSPSFSLASRKELDAPGWEKVRLEYSYDSAGVKLRAVTLIAAKGQRLWAVSFLAEPRRFIARKALFDKMETSFNPL